MTLDDAFIAVDWGTTNRRAYLIDAEGKVLRTERDGLGVLAIERDGFAAAAADIRARLGALPMLCAGMVGSNRGWAEVPYVDCPATFDSLASQLVWVEPGQTAIVPGVVADRAGRSDVMRGEEVQLLGAVHAGLTPPDALLCQPGTHCKWAWIEHGAITDFATAMTGELFAMLRDHSLLRDQIAGPVSANDDFLRGVADSGRGDLLADLFGVRADRVAGRNRIDDPAAYVSGLLIGTDARARTANAPRHVHLLADPALGALYGAALRAIGSTADLIDSHAAFVAGIVEIRRRMQ